LNPDNKSLASEFAGTSSGDIARELLEQVLIDRNTLEQLIEKVGEANPDLYDALGWIAERLSRIKLKHDDPAGIGAFEAFETISLGILGKRALWEALQVRQNADSRVAGIDYHALIARANHAGEAFTVLLASQRRTKKEAGKYQREGKQPELFYVTGIHSNKGTTRDGSQDAPLTLHVSDQGKTRYAGKHERSGISIAARISEVEYA
jgi:hypothetical protein